MSVLSREEMEILASSAIEVNRTFPKTSNHELHEHARSEWAKAAHQILVVRGVVKDGSDDFLGLSDQEQNEVSASSDISFESFLGMIIQAREKF